MRLSAVPGWAEARARVLANAEYCHLCGKPLDFSAPPRSRWSPSVDHILPRKAIRGLDRASQYRVILDPANLRPAHYGCNSGRGARVPKRRRTSREW